MLRALATHRSLLVFEKHRRDLHSLQPNKEHSYSYSVIRNHGSVVTGRFASPFCRIFSHFKFPIRRFGFYGRNRIKDKGGIFSYAKNLHAFSRSRSSMTPGAQLSWKRLSLVYTRRGPSFSTVSKMACLMSLAFTRFQVVPRILAFTVGEIALVRKARAEGEYIPTRDHLLTLAQDQKMYFTSAVHFIKESVILIFRSLYLAILFSPAIAIAPFADSFGIEFRKTWLQLVHHTLEKAGPAFIKWGQWAATRPDLFPKDLCMELSKLHSKAPEHSFAYSKDTIEKAFGRKLSEIFDHFEETPVASGSIAQVHRASLRFRYTGQELRKPIKVAVKVRHPGVGESIKRDFMIINLVAQCSRFIPALSWLGLDESVRQFSIFMMSQVDLSREAAHLSRFIYNFRRWKDVSFPKPLYPLVHPAVLVETFEEGHSVSRYIDDLDGNTRIKSDLAHIGTHALLKMLLVDNFIHADMHPGNLLVRLPPAKRPRKRLFRAKPHIVFLDVGMTAELSQSDRLNLLDFFKAVAIRDGRTAAESTLKLSRRQNCPNPKAFIEELERSFAFWGTPEGDLIHPAECMHQLLEQVRRHKVNIDGNVCTVLVTILILEGWQSKLDPSFDIMRTLKTLLLKEDWAQPIDYFFS